jgi:hypothetical protein
MGFDNGGFRADSHSLTSWKEGRAGKPCSNWNSEAKAEDKFFRARFVVTTLHTQTSDWRVAIGSHFCHNWIRILKLQLSERIKLTTSVQILSIFNVKLSEVEWFRINFVIRELVSSLIRLLHLKSSVSSPSYQILPAHHSVFPDTKISRFPAKNYNYLH